MVGFLFAFDVVLSLSGFDPLVKFSVSSAMYIIVDSYTSVRDNELYLKAL